jgi:7,8-dihydropterin-6-yl-methyl-4-(beta-D-ribofuranosyl)aminobenzene 5'-phosphate synthase
VVTITIVYDNNLYLKDFQNDWGFSCFIEGLGKTILFDTGGDGKILLDNMAKLNINPKDIEGVFLSHDHKDHTGGLDYLVKKNSQIDVWVPYFFSRVFKDSLRKKGAHVIETKSAEKICEGAHTTGVINGWIKEQSLLCETAEGLVLITGCAHPRIVHIVQTVKTLYKQDLRTVLGGFHLAGFEDSTIKEIIGTLQDEGIAKAGPCHCTGEEARQLFARSYGENFLELGVGKKLVIP